MKTVLFVWARTAEQIIPPFLTTQFLTTNSFVKLKPYPVYFDITKAAQNWADGTAPNYGIALRAASVGTSQSYIHFVDSTFTAASAYCPQFVVNYRDTEGIEDYWTYTTVPAGRGGALSVGTISTAMQ